MNRLGCARRFRFEPAEQEPTPVNLGLEILIARGGRSPTAELRLRSQNEPSPGSGRHVHGDRLRTQAATHDGGSACQPRDDCRSRARRGRRSRKSPKPRLGACKLAATDRADSDRSLRRGPCASGSTKEENSRRPPSWRSRLPLPARSSHATVVAPIGVKQPRGLAAARFSFIARAATPSSRLIRA
jgi:hypothetical protein